MNDKLEQLYNLYKQNGIIQSTDFNTFSSADENQRRKLYDLGKQKGLFNTTDFNTFSSAFQPVKKKEATVSPSVQKPKPISSDIQPKEKQKPSGTSVSGKPEGLYSAPGNQLAVFKKTSDGWYVDNNRSGNFIKLQKGDVEKRVASLEKDAKKFYDPTYEQNISWQAAPSKKEVKPVAKESQITERQFEEPINKELAQKAFDEEFFITPKKGMSSMEQVDFVAREKAKKELGDKATEQDLISAEQKYKTSGTLKMLQRKGYDVDINGTLDDPKAKKALAEFNANEQVRLKAEAKQDKLSNSIDNIINSKLMGLTEEQAVPQLNKQFGKYGFVFDQAGMGDAMTVRYSSDGITYTDPIDIDLQSGDAVQQMNILKSFMKDKYLNDSEIAALNDEKLTTKQLVKITTSDPKKYAEYALSEGQFENFITSEYRNANALKIQIDNKLSDFNKLSQQYNATGDENILNQLRDMESSIKNDQEKLAYNVADIEQTERKYKESVGSYILQKEKQGNFIGGLFASAAKGVASAPKMMMNIGVDILPEFLPNAGLNPLEYQKMKDDGFSDAQIQNKVSSQLKRTIGKEINQGLANVGSLGTVQNEYFSSVDRNILEQAVFGLAESVGAATSGGGNAVAQGLAFFGMSYNAMQDELSSKEFDELDKWEKQAVSGVYGLVIGQLEKIGFNMSAGQMKNPLLKKFTATVVKNALKDMPENATIETIDQLIGTSLKNTMKATGAKVVNGALSEGATEGIQSLAETGMKNIVNEIHDKKVFEYVPDLTTKKGIADALGSALYEAAAGAIGGAIMGSFDTYRQSRVNEQSDEKFQNMYQSLMDDNTLKAVKLNEIEKYKNGDISKDQMQSNIREINTTVSTLNKIPTELDTRGKRVAFELLSERDGLQIKIQGKDANLVASEINRINEIDNQLKTIGENAVKESANKEVTAEGSGVQYQGTQEGQPEVRQGEGAVGETTQPETDLGNRPVEGRSVQEEVASYIQERAKQTIEEGEKSIYESFSGDKVKSSLDPLMQKMQNAEYIDDTEIDDALNSILNEIDRVDNSNYSENTKNTIKDNLFEIAEKLDNYEFRTKDKTVTVTETRSTKSPIKDIRKNQQVSTEKFFSGAKAIHNGQEVIFDTSKGRTEAKLPDGSTIVFDTPTMQVAEDGISFDNDGNLSSIKMVDRFGSEFTFDGDIALDLAIKDRQNKIGEIPTPLFEQVFETVSKEVTTKEKYIKESKQPSATKPTEVTAVVQEEAAPDTTQVEPTAVAEEVTVEEPVAEEAAVAEEVERLGRLLEGTDQQIDEQVGKLKISKDNNKVAQSISNAAKSIAKILPDVKFVVHDTDESYRNATGEQNRKQSTAGEYNPKTRTIHINGTKANNRTAAHEVFHAVILEGVKNNAEAQRLTKAMIDAVRKSLVNVQGAGEIISYLNNFASNYEENIQNEEKLAELFGILSDSYATLPAPTQSLIRRFLDRIAKMFGLKPMTDREVIDFMNVVSQKVARGEEIQVKVFPTSGVSVQGLKVNTSKVIQTGKQEKSIRKQIDSSFEARKQSPKSITDIINAARQNGFSDAAIQQYLSQQGYSQQQITNAMAVKPASGVTIDDVFKKSQEELESKLKSRSIRQRIVEMLRSTRRTLLNRQTEIKRALRGIKNTEAKQAYAKLVTKAGASGFAGVRFKVLSKKIYGKLKEAEIEALDRIIYARRIISINQNRRKINSEIYNGLNPQLSSELDGIIAAIKNDSQKDLKDAKKRLGDNQYKDLLERAKKYKEPYTGIPIDFETIDSNGNIVKQKRAYNESDAQRDLVDKRAELGDERFNEINRRADMYFDVFSENLKKLKDSGRISEETYVNLRDVEYSPIKTIKYILKDNYDPNDLDKEAARLGISKKDIMSLSDSNENGIITDSRWLLMMNLNMLESRVFENQMLNELVSAIENATAQEKVALSDYFILDNPIIGQFKDGRPKRKFDDEALPDGYTRVHYFKDGIDNYIIAREEIAKQILDVKNNKITPAIEQFNEDVPILGWLVKQLTLTPSRLLRFFATGGNPFFILGNVPIDWANAVFFNQVYSHKWYEQLKVISGVKAAWGFVKNFTKSAISKGEWNKIYMEYAEHGGLMETMSQESMRALQEMKPTGRLAKKLPSVIRPIFKGTVNAPYKLLEGYGKVMSYLGETSEIAMRLAVYEKMKSNLIDDFKKENGTNPTGKALDDIMWEASREARELIDFNQGGSWSKEADVFMPYFNASMQGLRKPLDYAKENPVGFASSMVQLALMAGSVAAYSIAAGLSAFDDEDEEERKKKLRKALDSITAREKANYHIIFTGKIDKDGELMYIRIKKLPVASILTTGAEYLMYNKMIGYDNKEAEIQAMEAAVPFWPSELKSRNPLIAGLLTYTYNEDTFTGEKVFREPKNKKILPTAEGMFDDKVEGIYKALAPGLGLSPIRSKAFVEKFITSESTNPTINIIYAAANGIFDKGTTFGDEFKTMTEELLKHSERKFLRPTNKNIIQFNLQDEFEKKEMTKETEIYLKEQEIYRDIKRTYEKGGELTVEDLFKKVQDNFDPVDQERYLKKYYAYTQNMNIDKSLLDIVYESNPEVQAMRLYERYGDVMTSDEVSEIAQVLGNLGQRFDKKAMYFYQKNYGGVMK